MSTGRPTQSVPDDTIPQRAIRIGRQRAGEAQPVRLSELVTWSIAPSSRVAGMVHWAQRGTARACALVGVRRPVRTRVEDLDPSLTPACARADFASLQIVRAQTLVPGLGGGPRLALSLAGAAVVQGRRREELSLADLWLDTAEPAPGLVGPRKAVDAVWEAVISGTDRGLVVRGPWLHIAALGMLAGWAEPA